MSTTPQEAQQHLVEFIEGELNRRQRQAANSFNGGLWDAVRDAEDARTALEILRQKASITTPGKTTARQEGLL